MAYGEVQGKTWRSPSIRGLSDSEKLAWSYLLSNQHSNMLGYYLLPLPYMADDLEWPVERAETSITALERRGLIAYDYAAQVVFVCKYLKYNCLSSGNRATGALSRLQDIPESPLSKRLFAAISEWHPRLVNIREYLCSGNGDAPLLELVEESKKSPSCVNEESLVKAIDTVTVTDEVAVFFSRKNRKLTGRKLEWFEEFWDAFAYKKGKAAAADSWLDIKGLARDLVDAIVAGAKKEAIRRAGLREDQTAIMAQGWLTARRWEDDYEDASKKVERTSSPEAINVWESVSGELESELSSTAFETWLKNTIPIACEDGSFILGVVDAFTKGGIERRFGKRIEDMLREKCGHEMKLIMEVGYGQ